MKSKTMPRVMALLLTFGMVGTSVISMPVDAEAAAKVKLSATKQTMYVGGSFDLKVKNPKGKKATYKTDNKKVATVNKKGKVTAKSVGTANITVKVAGIKKAAKCKVTVKEGVKSIQTASQLFIQKGKKAKLNWGVTPNNVEKKAKAMSFKVDKKKIATVDKRGNVKAKKVGTAKITMQTAGGSAKATVKVKVVKKLTPVKSVSLNKAALALNIGASETLTATVEPAKATAKKVYWVSSNADVASVDKNGQVKAVADGTATITAYASDTSKKKATCTVTVTTPASAITLDQTALSLKVGGAAAKLNATVAPENAADKTVTWTVDNAAIATVTPEGTAATIAPVAAGTATVTATTANGISAACTVTVAPADPVEPAVREEKASEFDPESLAYRFTLDKAATEYKVERPAQNNVVLAADVAADYAKLTEKVKLDTTYWNNDFFKNQWSNFNTDKLSGLSAIFAGTPAKVTVENETTLIAEYGKTVVKVERTDAEAGQPCSLKVTKGDKVVEFTNVRVSKVDETVKIQADSKNEAGKDIVLTAEITENSVKLYKGDDSSQAHNVIMTLDVTETGYVGFVNGTNYGHIAEMVGVSVKLEDVTLYNVYK